MPQGKSNVRLKSEFELVYEEYFDPLFSYSLMITKSEGLSKDVVSDVFFRLLKSQTDLSSIKHLKAYLYTSVKNEAVRAVSSDPKKYDAQDQEHISFFTNDINPEQLMFGKELEEFLKKVIDNLPDQCGLVFDLVRQKNMSYEEAANEIGITVDTVKYHMKAALKKLRIELAEHFEDNATVRWMSGSLLAIYFSEWIVENFQEIY